MKKNLIVGLTFILFSILLSFANVFLITGAVIGTNISHSLITILTLAFFLLGLLFISRFGKGLAALVLAGTLIGGHAIHSHREKQYLEDTKITASWKTDLGKFQRTYRWDDELDKAERKYKIPKGLLKGLAMRESYGDPLRLNEGEDGGAGLFMFQPRTARAYGLKTYGKSNKSSKDLKHGEQLKDLVKKYKNDYRKLAEIDERFDTEKSAEAAAKYLREDYERYGSWDDALSAYNQGTPAPRSDTTEHVKAVKRYQKYYKKRDKH